MADLCSEPMVGNTDRNETLLDHDGTSVTYRTPHGFFPTESKAREFAAQVRVQMPFAEPVRDSNVKLGSPWSRNGGVHGAIDYWRTNPGPGIDPSFRVHAVADGVVKSVTWSHWLGNVVVIEHKAPNGARYRSLYHHVRNGRTNDLKNSESFPEPTGSDAFRADGMATHKKAWYEYVRLTPRPPDWNRWWGTDQQAIDVKPGQTVSRGDPIAWSGNTGHGGAGSGLEADPDKTLGMPKDIHSATNHLHFEFAVPGPGASADWARIDPYGVYGDNVNCYKLDQEIPYARMFAPFSRSFTNVSLGRLNRYWYYWTGIGLGLRTLSAQPSGGNVMAAGSFQADVHPAWRASSWMSRAELDTRLVALEKEGYRPTNVDVGTDAGGQPRFTVIWRKSAPKDTLLVPGATTEELESLWADRVLSKGGRFDSVATYVVAGTRRHCIIAMKDDAGSCIFHPLLTRAEFKKKYAELDKEWVIHGQHAVVLREEVRFNAIWRPKTHGVRASRVDLSRKRFDEEHLMLTTNGYHLHQVQSYKDASLLAGIWAKD